jgi:hypothetical protein
VACGFLRLGRSPRDDHVLIAECKHGIAGYAVMVLSFHCGHTVYGRRELHPIDVCGVAHEEASRWLRRSDGVGGGFFVLAFLPANKFPRYLAMH